MCRERGESVAELVGRRSFYADNGVSEAVLASRVVGIVIVDSPSDVVEICCLVSWGGSIIIFRRFLACCIGTESSLYRVWLDLLCCGGV